MLSVKIFLTLYLFDWTLDVVCVNQYNDVDSHLITSLQDYYNMTCEKQYNYECQVPEMATAAEALEKICNYRNVLYYDQIYKWVSGRGCLLYTPNFLYTNGVNPLDLSATCMYGALYAPCIELPQSSSDECGCFPYDPSFNELIALLEVVLADGVLQRWLNCYYEAENCCDKLSTNGIVGMLDGYCGVTFDGWSCWEKTPWDTVAEQVCSDLAYTGTGATCNHYSHKSCIINGTWSVNTDYTTCSISERLIVRTQAYVYMLSISIAICVPAIIVFYVYKRLRVDRVVLHRNLLLTIVIRNILVAVTRNVIHMDELTNTSSTIMSRNEWSCKLLAVMERLASNMVFVCMLVEGVYLHRLLAAVFRKKLNINILYTIGAGIAIVPVIVWSVVMSYMDDTSCWLVYNISHIQWVLDVPRILILVINTTLFIDILRVLLTKFKSDDSQLKTTKATLFLMPLFGTQFLLTAYRPTTDNCSTEQGYYLFTYWMEAMQGTMVAILYCYTNKEVHSLIIMTYRRTNLMNLFNMSNIQNKRIANKRLTLSTGITSEAINNNSKDVSLTPTTLVITKIPIETHNKDVNILADANNSKTNNEEKIMNEGFKISDDSDTETKDLQALNSNVTENKIDSRNYQNIDDIKDFSDVGKDYNVDLIYETVNKSVVNNCDNREINSLNSNDILSTEQKTDNNKQRNSIDKKVNIYGNPSDTGDAKILSSSTNSCDESKQTNYVLNIDAMFPNRSDIIFIDDGVMY